MSQLVKSLEHILLGRKLLKFRHETQSISHIDSIQFNSIQCFISLLEEDFWNNICTQYNDAKYSQHQSINIRSIIM